MICQYGLLDFFPLLPHTSFLPSLRKATLHWETIIDYRAALAACTYTCNPKLLSHHPFSTIRNLKLYRGGASFLVLNFIAIALFQHDSCYCLMRKKLTETKMK